MFSRLNFFQSSELRRVAVPLMGGFAVAALALLVIVFRGASALDTNEVEKEKFVVAGIIERLKTGVAYTLMPEANWDEAYQMLAAPIDKSRVRSQIGPDAILPLDIEGLYVFDPSNTMLYGVFEKNELSAEALPDDTDMRGFADMARRTLASGAERFVTGIVAHYGILHVVAAALIQPTTPSLRDPSLDRKIMIVERAIDPQGLVALGKEFMIGKLDQIIEPGEIRLDLQGPTGKPAGLLSWAPRHPGAAFIASKVPPIVLVMIVLSAFNIFILRNWLKVQTALHKSEARTAALEQANQTKSVLLSHLSHELRTPLNAIIGFAQLMKTESRGPDDAARRCGYAQDVELSGKRLLSILNVILELAALDGGKYPLQIGEIDLEAALAASLRGVSQLAGERTVHIEVQCPEPLINPISDEKAVRRILSNLLDNAVKYSVPGSTVMVSVRQEDQDVAIEIQDNGPGMSAEKLEQAMMPFGLPLDVLNRQSQGIGLGLALCRALAARIGASLSLTSAVGQGSCAVIRLPLSLGQDATANAQAA